MFKSRNWFVGTRFCSLVAAAGLLTPGVGSAQADRDVGAALAGGLVGAYAGATLGLVAGVAPCSLSVRGTRCARVAGGLGTLVGSTSGAVVAYHDPGLLDGRLLGAGVGALAGIAVGLGSRAVIPQIGWRDVGAAAAVGAAVGTAPVGSALGLGAGLALGSLLWLASGDYALPETAALGTVGLAIGGLMEWAYSAASAASPSRPVFAQFTVTF